MAYTEVTETGWFGRIGRSIKGILFGIVLIPVSVILLGWNERNAVQDIQANAEIGANVNSVSNDKVDAANAGKLIHVNGPTKTTDVISNPQFGIETNAIRLRWIAEIYQWKQNERTRTEKKVGGGERRITEYTYEKIWSDDKINSSNFKESGHDNTGRKIYDSGSSQAKNVTLGAFKLPDALISKISSSQAFACAQKPAGDENGSISGGEFYTGDPGNPSIGDEKVRFTITLPGDVSVMAVQTGDSFSAYTAESGKTKFLLSVGMITAEQMVKQEEQKAMMLRWLLRGGGLLAMFIGFCVIMGPLSVLADVIPFIGNLVGGATAIVSLLITMCVGSIVIAISWVAFRPMVGIPLLVLAAAAIAALIARAVARGRAGA